MSNPELKKKNKRNSGRGRKLVRHSGESESISPDLKKEEVKQDNAQEKIKEVIDTSKPTPNENEKPKTEESDTESKKTMVVTVGEDIPEVLKRTEEMSKPPASIVTSHQPMKMKGSTSVKSSVVTPFKWTGFSYRLRSDFYSMYNFYQTERGASIAIVPEGIKINRFVSTADFYTNALPALVYKIEEAYGGLLNNIPSENFSSGLADKVGNPTRQDAIGMQIAEFAKKARDRIIPAQFHKRFFLNEAFSNYYYPGHGPYSLEDCVCFQDDWEWRLQNDLSESEKRFYFDLSEARGSNGIYSIVQSYYDYFSMFNTNRVYLSPSDPIYKGEYTSVGRMMPFMKVNNNFPIWMQTNMAFRNAMFQSFGSLFNNTIKVDYQRGASTVANAMSYELGINVNTIQYSNQILQLVDRIPLESILPTLATVMMFSRYYKFQNEAGIRTTPDVNDLVGAICDRLVLPRKAVTDLHAKSSSIMLICNFAVFFAENPLDEVFSMEFWTRYGATIDEPWNRIIPSLRVPLQKAFRDFFGESDHGDGWAGAGVNPTKRYNQPSAGLNFTLGSEIEAWCGLDLRTTFDPQASLQMERFAVLTNLLASVNLRASIAVGNKATNGMASAVVGAMMAINRRQSNVCFILNALTKLNYLVSFLPLAMTDSDDKSIGPPQYDTTANYLYYDQLGSTTQEERRKFQQTLYKDAISIRPIPKDFSFSLVLGPNINGGYDISLDKDAILTCFEINKALTLFGKHVIYQYYCSKTFNPKWNLPIINNKWLDALMHMLDNFESKETVDPNLKRLIRETMLSRSYTFPPLDGCGEFMVRVKSIVDLIASNTETFGFGTAINYGGVEPFTDYQAEAFDSTVPIHHTFLNVNDETADYELAEVALRSGPNALTVWSETEALRKSGDILCVYFPYFIDLGIKTCDSILEHTYDKNYVIEDPISFDLSTSHAPYVIQEYKIHRAYKDTMHSPLYHPFVKNPTWMIANDPVRFLTSREFVETIQSFFHTSRTLVFTIITPFDEFKSIVQPSVVVHEFNNIANPLIN
jgi:hypothetical protein